MSESERDRIASIEDRIRAAYLAGDAEAVAAQYTGDAILAGPDNPPLVGREAIAEVYRGFFAAATAELENEIEEIEVMADGWAFVRGRLRVRSTPKDGGETDRRTGRYLAIARREPDGVWRFARDLFALDSPEA